MKEYKSTEVMHSSHTSLRHDPKSDNRIRMQSTEDSRDEKNSSPEFFQLMKEYKYIGMSVGSESLSRES
jgi:hypothetical protein